MKLLLSSVLLASLCDISSWSVSMTHAHVVTQTSDVSVAEGETVNITCCYNKNDSQRMRFYWLKNQTKLKSDIVSLNRQYPVCSNLTLSNVRTKDSGKYICEMSLEIPTFDIHIGNGTVVTVKSTGSSDEHISNKNNKGQAIHIISITVAVVILLFLLIAFCCFYFLRLRKTQVARVIYEVPHFDSEAAETDKHSTNSSTGSTQWRQVVVYESVDYFERVQNKDSG